MKKSKASVKKKNRNIKRKKKVNKKKNYASKKKINSNAKKKIKKKEKKLYNKRKIVWILFTISCLILLSYSIYNTIIWNMDNEKQNQIKEEIIDNVDIEEINDTEDDNSLVNIPDNKDDIYWKYKNTSLINVDIQKLKKENNDTVGWLQVLGTNINYPVVQSKDNYYYLKHDFLKRKNAGGWVFLDYRNNFNNLSYNNIIYGHHRYNKAVFGTLKNILNDSWLNNKDNHIIKVSTDRFNYLFQIFSIYTVPYETYYMKTDFASIESYKEFLDTITSRSIYNFNTDINTDIRILTLSTCHNNNKDRLVVHAKLIKKVEKNLD